MIKHVGEEDGGARAAAAFARVSWRALLPLLLRRASLYLSLVGLADGRRYHAAALEGCDLVNMTFERFQTGRRRWPLAPDAPESDFVAVYCETMRSIAVDVSRSAPVARRAEAEAADRHGDDRPPASQRVAYAEQLARLAQVFHDDAEATAVLRAYCEGAETREELAASQGWDVAHLDVVERRMSRRLESRGITFNGEAGPPSSSPNGRDHGTTQAAGERRRAPGERDRGAGLAPRRGGSGR